ncbi:hypothetical protein Y032_0020g209 [Ancylostoma ceylanicum]|uniref:Uncharacterized protein n=1 Tax=Ancylostoma ceylanicum TaxID=53326 RepID=A0A016V1G1_9BILA|nr:hypothetical protein Y032_0020g209 [Ancylostoma ceylanicum]
MDTPLAPAPPIIQVRWEKSTRLSLTVQLRTLESIKRLMCFTTYSSRPISELWSVISWNSRNNLLLS